MRTALIIVAICIATQATATTHYVDQGAEGANDGSSWTHAWVDLQDALGAAVSGDQIWVARGVYTPSATGNRFVEFRVPTGVQLYGGFTGTEARIEERDASANPTVLSGDVGERRPEGSAWDPTAPWATDNTVRLLLLNATAAGTVIDGFELSESGRAMDVIGGAPLIRDCIVRWNQGRGQGIGALVRFRSRPVFEDVTFEHNSSTGSQGGGLASDGGSSPTFLRVVFRENSAAEHGGGMSGHGSFTNVIFESNRSKTLGGGLWARGGVLAQNVSFVGNHASHGAALYLGVDPGLTAPTGPASRLVNLTIADNASGMGADIECASADLELVSSVIADGFAGTPGRVIAFTEGTVTLSHSLVQGCGGSGAGWNPEFGIDLGSNLDSEPGYAGADDYRLATGSPAIDTGDSEAVLGGTTTDLDGNPRVTGECVDMGAWEFQGQDEPEPELGMFAAELNPRSLNLQSQGRFVTLVITSTGTTPVEEIDVGSLRVFDVLSPQPGRHRIEDGMLSVKFDRAALVDLIEPEATVSIEVTGSVLGGARFEATAEIRIVGHGMAQDGGPVRAFPNPFNPSTTIHFELDRSMRVELSIFDLAGRRVRTLVSGALPAGTHGEQWDGTDSSGRLVSSGTYFARVRTEDYETVGRLVLVK
jgi:predicted outer membrane repeat protein